MGSLLDIILHYTKSFSFNFRVGAFFFVVMNQIFANLSAIDLFILERGIFM